MSTAIVKQQRFRSEIPRKHKASLDTRIAWLWRNRWGTVEAVYQDSRDPVDRMVAQIFIQAVVYKDIESIRLIFNRLAGAPLDDAELRERVASSGDTE